LLTKITHNTGGAEASGEYLRPTVSASEISKKKQELYDAFAQVCGVDTYVANSRIQELTELNVDPEQTNIFRSFLLRSLQHVNTFRNIAGGSETMIVDSNLQIVLNMMSNLSERNLKCMSITIPPDLVYLASAVKPEHCLRIPDSSVPGIVFGSEVKGIEASIRQCYPQLMTVCGSSCIELYRQGLSRKDCVVPGIAMAGVSCQFLAIYLLKDTFPVLVALSPELSPFGSFEEQRTIARWCLRMVSLADATVVKLGQRRRPILSTISVFLNMKTYFAKPVRKKWRTSNQDVLDDSIEDETQLLYSNKNTLLNYVMRVYERIRVACKGQEIDIKSLVLFPEGVVSMPGANIRESDGLRKMLIRECRRNQFGDVDESFRPLIIFPRLLASKGWSMEKPPPELRIQYVKQLTLAVTALNVAKIAHLDLRPANIMWREARGMEGGEEGSCVELQLIDFEDAVFFEDLIPAGFVKFVVEYNDSRYPFVRGDEKTIQLARKFHNDFFLEAVSQWAASEVIQFEEFMRVEGRGVHQRVLEAEANEVTEEAIVKKGKRKRKRKRVERDNR